MGMMARGALDRQGRRKYLTDSEGRKFLAKAAALPPVEAAFCLTVYYTGCRISEALNLTGDEVDHSSGAVVIHTLKRRRDEIRRIPVPKSLTAKLRVLNTNADGQRIFPFCRTTGWRIVKRVMADAGILGVPASPKGLRHSFGARCALKGIPLHIIRDFMGHAYSTTTEIYLAIKGEEERELIRKTW